MEETAKMPVAASSAETRNSRNQETRPRQIGELTKSIGNISFSSSREDSILKKEISENLTETNKVRRLPMPRSRPIDRKQVDQLIDRLIKLIDLLIKQMNK